MEKITEAHNHINESEKHYATWKSFTKKDPYSTILQRQKEPKPGTWLPVLGTEISAYKGEQEVAMGWRKWPVSSTCWWLGTVSSLRSLMNCKPFKKSKFHCIVNVHQCMHIYDIYIYTYIWCAYICVHTRIFVPPLSHSTLEWRCLKSTNFQL